MVTIGVLDDGLFEVRFTMPTSALGGPASVVVISTIGNPESHR